MLFGLARYVEAIARPCRVILDSLVPLALGISPGEFVSLIYRKNRLLRRPDVAIFDIMLWDTVRDHNLSNMLNTFDVVLDLYTPNWGEMNLAGSVGYRALQIRKARGVWSDSRPFPYTISTTEGIVIQSEYYRKLVEL
jgi:circadian clock protein KaiC